MGPSVGIDSGDQVWLSRYILNRVAEDFGAVVSYEPKPIKGDWNGAGSVCICFDSFLFSFVCRRDGDLNRVSIVIVMQHTNYSTKSMREDGGYKVIVGAIERLGKAHKEHMAAYGKNNEERLTGKHETARYDQFKYGVADRGASIRIPRQTEIDQKGYFEDRRPAANCDPYLVTSMIAKTTILGSDDE